MKLRVFATVALLSTVVGCTTMDPYTDEERTASATRGAAIGAVAGAIVGIATGGDARQRRQRALIGAGVGGLTGGAIGNYMDRQEEELRRQLRGTGVSVTRHGDNITLNMPGNITFGFDSDRLDARFFEVLDSVVLVLEEFDQTLVEVAGHTDSVGAASYNQQLSVRRAAAVGDYLEQSGVDHRRLIIAGYGESYPIASNDTESGRQANRRVELTLVPLER